MKIILPIIIALLFSTANIVFASQIGVYEIKGDYEIVEKIEERLSTPELTEKKVYSQSEIHDLICDVFGDECDIAVAIAKAESGLRCDRRSYKANTNGTYDHGLFQINDTHRSRYPHADFYDCKTSIRIAKDIRESWKGYHAWSVYNNKSYLKFL